MRDRSEKLDRHEHRLPFTARVAVEWVTGDDSYSSQDRELGYWFRVPMTGNVITTSDGQDVGFSDIEVS